MPLLHQTSFTVRAQGQGELWLKQILSGSRIQFHKAVHRLKLFMVGLSFDRTMQPAAMIPFLRRTHRHMLCLCLLISLFCSFLLFTLHAPTANPNRHQLRTAILTRWKNHKLSKTRDMSDKMSLEKVDTTKLDLIADYSSAQEDTHDDPLSAERDWKLFRNGSPVTSSFQSCTYNVPPLVSNIYF